MPPRHVYWTIIADGQPTAFRAATPEELLPTLKQLQSKHPDAKMMWFARGKLWPTKEAAEFSQRQERQGTAPPRERRGKDWRPGGEHQDPRDRFKITRDEKRRRFADRARRDRMDEERPASPPGSPKPWGGGGKPRSGEGGPFKPGGERPPRPSGPRSFRPEGDRPFRPKGDRPAWGKSPASPKPRSGEGGPFRPKGDRPFRPREDRPQGDRPAWGKRPASPPGSPKPWGGGGKPRSGEGEPFKPKGDRPFRPREDRPPGDRPFRPREDRPQGDRPFKPKGDRPFRPKGDRPPGGGFRKGPPKGGPRGGGSRGGPRGGGRGPR